MSKQLIEHLLNKLVQFPEQVEIEQLESNGKCVFQVRVSPSDLPRVIGKEGKMFKALRSIVVCMSEQDCDLTLDTPSKNI